MHFERDYGVSCMMTACEYLADQGLIGKASAPVQLTKKSNIQVQELAFVHVGTSGDAPGNGSHRSRVSANNR
jgi:hypothetical protein